MNKLNKRISHHDRMCCDDYRPTVKIELRGNTSLSKTQCVVDGRVTYKSEFVKKDNLKSMRKFNVNDFCIENLEAIGALDGLSQTHLTLDKHTMMRNIENGINSLETDK